MEVDMGFFVVEEKVNKEFENDVEWELENDFEWDKNAEGNPNNVLGNEKHILFLGESYLKDFLVEVVLFC